MTLAIFDLDNTLLSGDSDFEWGRFLVRKNLVDEEIYETANARFYEQYQRGELDIFEYSAFSFKPLADHSIQELHLLHREYMEEVIQPMIGNKAKSLVEKHRQRGHTLMVMTSTNSFITRPIVQAFNIAILLATEPKIINGRYTTEIEGIPCFKEGKVERLNNWLAQNNASLEGSFFYSDSYNDLPLLEQVESPIAVDPDKRLAALALQRGWQIISLLDS